MEKSYSKYFGAKVRDEGIPNLDPTQYRKMMNIVFIEGQLHGLKRAKALIRNPEQKEMFSIEIFKVSKMLTEETGNLEPKELLEKLILKETF